MCHATFGHIPIPKLAKFQAPSGIVLEDGTPTPDHWKSPIFRWLSYCSPQNYSGCCSNHQIIHVFISTSPAFRKKHQVNQSSCFPSFSIIFHPFPNNSPALSLSIPWDPHGIPSPFRFVPGRQRHHGAPARAPGAAPGRRGAGLPAAGSGADAGEAAAGRVGRLDGRGW